jgi:hypothetical protein
MRRQVNTALDPECFAAIRTVVLTCPPAESAVVPAARIVPTLREDYQQAA